MTRWLSPIGAARAIIVPISGPDGAGATGRRLALNHPILATRRGALRIEQAWAELHAAADVAAARGSLLFHLDLATELARGAFEARGVPTDGLATLIDEQGYRVFAFGGDVSRHALAEVRFESNGAALVLPSPVAMPPLAPSLAEARATLLAARFDGDRQRAVIIVPESDPRAPLQGYALVASSGPETAHLTDHWLLSLDPAGRRITARRQLAAAIAPAACSVRHLRDVPLGHDGAVPNELHTYLSLKHGVPIIVETIESGARWRVDGERTSAI